MYNTIDYWLIWFKSMGIGNDPYQDNGGSEEEEEFEEHQELAENPNEERSFYDL